MFKTPFKPIGHYVFDYKPRYYDERKERLDALEEKYKHQKQTNNDSEYQITLSKNNLKNEWSRTRSGSNADRKSTYRLAIIIALLVGIAMYVLK